MKKTQILGIILLVSLLGYQLIFSPTREEKTRNLIQPKVFKVVDAFGTRGGTGFYVEAPSGRTYILTNDHVCDVADINNFVYIQDEANGDRLIPRRIIEHSAKTDLCLIENMPNQTESIKVADDYYVNEQIYIFGYPRLLGKARVTGEIFARRYVDVPLFKIVNEETEAKCSLPKHKIQELDLLFFSIKVCSEHIDAIFTTAPILPGNSGSPVVNVYGELVGVAFAAGEDNWGLMVELQELKDFLKIY